MSVATMTDICRIDNVTKTFGRTRALDGVTFDLTPGITGLLGPNGAGKTTLLTMLATIQTPDHGSLELLGLDPSKSAERTTIRRRLGYMPQEPGFHMRFTTFDFIDYVGILKEMTDRRTRHDEVRRVISEVGLDDKADSKIKTLSGGMRRRVALAQSLLGDPELLILDEPTAGLDPEQRYRFRDLISRLGEDRTVVVSTHQTEDVAALCTDVVVMHEGRVLMRGTPDEIAAAADGHVWLSDTRDPKAELAWRTAQGRYRNVGDAPADADLIDPTIEDGYLMLVGDPAAIEEQRS